MKVSIKSYCAFLIIFSSGICVNAAQKYVGIHYFPWYTDATPWSSVWGLNNYLQFEDGNYNGFNITGTAFGSSPRNTPLDAYPQGSHGLYWADSRTSGEQATGVLRSSPFILGDSFSFFAAGWDGPNGNKNANSFSLIASDGTVIQSAKPPQSSTFTLYNWDMSNSPFKGSSVIFEAADNCADSGYAWLAASGVRPVIPMLGRYLSNTATGYSHGLSLSKMGVDFAMIDNTNNTLWPVPGDYCWENTKAIADGFAQANSTTDANATKSKVAVLLSVTLWDADRQQVLITQDYTDISTWPGIQSNAGTLFLAKVSALYNQLANNPEKYFYYENKPLLFLFVSAAGTVLGKDSNGEPYNATPDGKLPDSWDPIVPDTNNKTLRQLFAIRWVGAWQNYGPGRAIFTDAADGNGLKAIHGHWSWEDTYPQTWASRPSFWGDSPEAITVAPFARCDSNGNSQTRSNGSTFNNMWCRAYDIDPVFCIIHSWNEFSAGDEPSPEASQSIEPDKYYYQDRYMKLATKYIEHFKKFRMDIGLYDTYARAVFIRNRTANFNPDIAGSETDPFTFGFETAHPMDIGPNVECIAGDFNGDGKTDIALRNIDTGLVAIRFAPYFTVEGSGDQLAEKDIQLEAGSRYKMFAGDFNHDGKTDIGFYDAQGGANGPGFIIRYNDGICNFNEVYTWPYLLPANYQFSSIDTNHGGVSDIVYRDPASGTIWFLMPNGDGFKTAGIQTYYFPWWQGAGDFFQLITSDVNGDGYGDIGLRNTTTGTIYMLQNMINQSGNMWIFSNQQQYDWAIGTNYLPISGDFR